MNTIRALALLGLVAVTCAANANRNVGWGAPGPVPAVDIELVGVLAAEGAGSAEAHQVVHEEAHGAPAEIESSSGVLALVEQDGTISQVAAVHIPTGTTSTVNVVDVENTALGVDALEASINAADSLLLENQAGTNVYGDGNIAAAASSSNTVTRP